MKIKIEQLDREIDYEITHLGLEWSDDLRDEVRPWFYDHWIAKINGIPVDYKTGIGHRSFLPIEARTYKGNILSQDVLLPCEKYREILLHDSTPVIPKVESILASVVMDAAAGSQTFREFCSDCGYDDDSIKAFKVYMECQTAVEKLEKMKLGKCLADLQEAFQDY